jgi:hypothetical protein
MASFLKAELAASEENVEEADNQYDFAIAAAHFLKSVNEMVSEAMALAHLQAIIALDCII